MNTANARLFRALSLSMLTTLLVAPTQAQVIGPTNPTPQLPQLQALPSGVLAADNNGTVSVAVNWYQPVSALSFQSINPTHFAVCLRTAGINCTWPSVATAGVFNGAATGSIFTRTAVTTRSPFMHNGPPILVGYNYSTSITLNNTFYDRQLKWSVAACADASAGNCMAAVGPSVFYTTKELVADVRIVYQPPNIGIVAEGVNLGTSPAHTFSNRVSGYSAIIGASGLCATNPNETNIGVTNQTRLFTSDGVMRLAGTIHNGTSYVTTGITIMGMSNVSPLSASGTTTSASPLQPETDPERKTDLASRTMAISGIVSNSTTRYGVLAVGKIDELGQITETNEGDNGRAECLTFGY